MTDVLERPDVAVLDPALAELTDDQLTTLFDTRLAACRAADHALLATQAEIDARRMGAIDGVRNLADWTAMRTGEGDRTARRHARLATTLGHHPTLADALADGTLSAEHTRLLTHIAALTDTDDDALVDLGTRHTVSQLETILRSTRRLHRRTHNDEHERRSLRWWVDDNGTFHLTGRLTGTDGLTVTEALAAIAETNSAPNPETGLHDPYDTRLADALVEICTGPDGSVTENATVIIHAPLDALRTDPDPDPDPDSPDDDLPGVPQTSDGTIIANHVLARLLCDTRIRLAIDNPAGATVGIGRRSRIVPYWLHQQVRWRDRTCRFPGCTQTRFTHCHHQRHWAHGGPTDLGNLILLCTHHHRLLHEGDWTLTGHPDGQLIYTSPTGRTFTTDPAPHHLRRRTPRRRQRQQRRQQQQQQRQPGRRQAGHDPGPPGTRPAP